MHYLKTSEAATLLNVSPNTLRQWEARFDFPKPQRSPGRHRMYMHCEVAALREALYDGLSVSSAVSRARERLAADNNSLVTALGYYDRDRADVAIEVALGSRSVEHAVEEVLLPGLEQIIRQQTVDSAAWAFAAPWGADWLRRATRLAPPPLRPWSILVGDASRDDLDPDALYIRALEIAGALEQLAGLAELVLTTGGTGFAPRDVTPEATAAVVERPTPGLDEAMREVSRRASPHGLLSRGSSGIRGAALIVNFPGSPRACAECFDAIAPALGHGIELLTSRPTEHP